MRSLGREFCALALALCLPAGLTAQDRPPLDLLKLKRTERLAIPRLGGPITFDGPSGEAAWRDVPVFPMVMMMPNFGEPPSERTEVLLAFDDEYLYVAGRLYDREPDKIQCPTKKRDAMVACTEWFGVILDTFNDKENAMTFFTAPSGLRLDSTVYMDAQAISPDPNDAPLNVSWNTFWDVAVTTTAEGWFAEIRIPLSSLRFQEKDGKVVMGLLAERWLARKNEMDVFPAVPPNWGQMSSWKPSQGQEIEFEGLRSRRPLYVTPYVLGGGSRVYDLDATGTRYVMADTPKLEAGLDVKYGLTSNLTLDLTVNTDFAQVEADDVQVNLTRFSLFLPEKRVFFQERSSNFSFSLGAREQLFYSRRIGIAATEDDEYEPVRIYGGARVVGRIGGWDVGFLDMQTAPAAGLSTENLGVLRLRRRVFNPFSYVGGIVTSRIGRDGTYNTAYGLDGIFRLFGDDYLSFHWAQVFQDGAANRALSLDPSRFGLTWERRKQIGLGYNVGFVRSGRDFDPGLGFLLREDYTRLGVKALYGWAPGKDSKIFSHDVYFDGTAYWDNATGRPESMEIGPGWEASTKSGWNLVLWPKVNFEDVAEEFSFADEAVVPPGRYTFPGLIAVLVSPQGNLFSWYGMVEGGAFYDGSRASISFFPTWSGIRNLEFGGMLQYNDVRFPARGQRLVAPLARIRVLATVTTAFSAGAFIQYNGADDAVIANIRLRYNPKEGTDVYLVFNEGLNTDRLRRVPALPSMSDRTLAVKINYTFNF